MKTRFRFVLLCALGGLTACSGEDTPRVGAPSPDDRVGVTHQALTSVDTTPYDFTVYPFGNPSLATVGQVITVPAGDGVLQSLGFELVSIPSSLLFRAEVYAWDSGNNRATGPNLYESSAVSTSGASAQVVTFDTGNLALTPGGTYVAFITTSKDATGAVAGGFGARSGDQYAGGDFVYLDNQTDTSQWTSSAWTTFAGFDLSFQATFNSLVSSTTSLASSSNPSVFGQSVTFTATVSGSAGTPTGTVTFVDGATTLGTATLNGAGQASVSASSLSVGSHSITASYGGDSSYLTSTSSALTQTVNQADSTTQLNASANPSIVGGSVTLTATVSAVAPGAGVPTGTVTFLDGATTIGTGMLDGSGQAAVATSALALGSHSITAVYGGDADFLGSTSPALSQVVNLDGATVILASGSNPSTFGSSVTFTATVTSNGSGGTPTGLVVFLEGATILGIGSLDGSGQATYTTSALSGGSHSMIASYGGDTKHDSAKAQISQVVTAAGSSTTLASATNPSVFGQSVTFTATVSGTGATPSGTVTFLEGATTLGTGSLNGAGQATFSTSALAVAAHNVTATYGGDTNFATSTASAVTQTVSKADSVTALAASSNPDIVGSNVTFTATVSADAPGAGLATGTMTFLEGPTTLGSATLDGSGVATFTTSALGVGSHVITAHYQGDGGFNASMSTSLSEVINQDGVTATLASSANPSTFGASVSFTATVASTGSGGTPTGTVTFYDGATTLQTATLDGSGSATLTTTALAGGSHSITAVYGGDANHEGGSSAALSQVVDPAVTTTTLSASSNPSVFGETVTFTATVASSASGMPTGTVTFTDGATTLGTVTVGNDGTATFSGSAFTVANHPIGAVYGGDANYATSTAMALSQVVNKAPSSITLASSSSPSALGEAVTFTATVTATAPGAGTPTGTVTFMEGATTLGTGSLSAGTATFSTSSLPVGSHTITASYAGDGSFQLSTSDEIAQAVTPLAAMLALTADPSPASFGEQVDLTVTVSGASGTPTGSVTFKTAQTTLGTTTLDDTGVAVFSASGLAPGMITLEADYSGDSVYGEGTGSVTLVVNKAGTTTTLVASNNPATLGENVTFTATVASPATGLTGSVEFFDGTTSLGTEALAGDEASFETSELTQGGHSISATYSGDDNFDTSTSMAITQMVIAADMGATGDAGVEDGGVSRGDEQPDAEVTDSDAGAHSGDDTGNAGTLSGGGCSCRMVPSPSTSANAPLLALFALSLFIVRRRRAARTARTHASLDGRRRRCR